MTEKTMTDKKTQPVHPVLKHFREDSPGTPHLWCPGCGVGQVFHFTTKAIEELGLDEDRVLWVGGSGCTGRMCTYWHKDFFQGYSDPSMVDEFWVTKSKDSKYLICRLD